MNRARLALLLILVPLAISAEEASAPGRPSAFIDSDPMGARIVLDHQLLAVSTPVLLRDLTPGEHTVSLSKNGFADVDKTFTVGDSVAVVEAQLPPNSVLLSFPSNAKLTAPGGSFETAAKQFRFASGGYTLRDENGTAVFEPIFPDQGLLDLAGWSLGIVTASAAVSWSSDLWHIRQGWTDHPSVLSAALLMTALFELPWFLSINGSKDRFDKTKIAEVTPLPIPLVPASALFQQGDTAQKVGDLDGAAEAFGRFVRDYPSSQLVPGAWFRLARIHSVTGKRELALGEYRLVAETYPQAAYYDRARQAMADLYEAAGNPKEAAAQLDLMALSGGLFSKDDIEAQKSRLRAQEATLAP